MGRINKDQWETYAWDLLEEKIKLERENERLLLKISNYFCLTCLLLGIIGGSIGYWFFSNNVNISAIIARYQTEVEKSKAYNGNLALALKNTLFFKGYFPASYEFDNIISVGALYKDETMRPQSNYGRGVTSLAPGKSFSTSHGGGYGWDGAGTSQSAAVVTGALVLLKARFPNKSPKELIEIFKTCHRKPEALKDKSVFGVLDLSKCKIDKKSKKKLDRA